MNAVVTRVHDEALGAWLFARGYRYVVQDGWDLPEERTLFVASGVAVPRHLLDAGFRLLDAWEMAAPLWRYGVLAQDVGTPQDRQRTKRVALDLRVLLYAHELLFVRREGSGERFLRAWRGECEGGGDERLAFLRAFHMVKPILCTLPSGWLLGASVSPPMRRVRAPAAGAVWTRPPRVSRGEKDPPLRPQVRRR